MECSAEDGWARDRGSRSPRGAEEPVDVVAVVGSCPPERQALARGLAQQEGRVLLPAGKVQADVGLIDRTADLLARSTDGPGLVVELPLGMPAMEAIGLFAEADGATRLSDMVCVVDAAHLLADLDSPDLVPLPGGEDHARRADLVVQQIEHASQLVLARASALAEDRLLVLEALVAALSPQAAIRRTSGEDGDTSVVETLLRRRPTPYQQEQTRAGWVGVLNGEVAPTDGSAPVEVLHYEQLRPFHPGRLHAVLETFFSRGSGGSIVRSAGFCRLASRPHVLARWDQVGRSLVLEPLAVDGAADAEDVLSFGQDLAIVSVGMDARRLVSALDEAVLDDQELTAGPAAWSQYADPFPRWNVAPDR